MILGVVYIPPENSNYYNEDEFLILENEILSFSSENKFVLLSGDFNAKTGQLRDYTERDDFLSDFLAHLSQRLIGELIGYPWSGVRPSVRRRRPFTMLKDLLLQNRLANQSQILCGASLGRGNDILFPASGSHDQDGRHAHIW